MGTHTPYSSRLRAPARPSNPNPPRAPAQEELALAARRAARGDWAGVWAVAVAHRGLLLGVLAPAVLLLRFPAAAPAALRLALGGGQLLLLALARTGNLELAARLLWRRVVSLAERQRLRRRRDGGGGGGGGGA